MHGFSYRRLFVSNGKFHEEVEDTANNLKKFSKDVDDVRKKSFETQGLVSDGMGLCSLCICYLLSSSCLCICYLLSTKGFGRIVNVMRSMRFYEREATDTDGNLALLLD